MQDRCSALTAHAPHLLAVRWVSQSCLVDNTGENQLNVYIVSLLQNYLETALRFLSKDARAYYLNLLETTFEQSKWKVWFWNKCKILNTSNAFCWISIFGKLWKAWKFWILPKSQRCIDFNKKWDLFCQYLFGPYVVTKTIHRAAVVFTQITHGGDEDAGW